VANELDSCAAIEMLGKSMSALGRKKSKPVKISATEPGGPRVLWGGMVKKEQKQPDYYRIPTHGGSWHGICHACHAMKQWHQLFAKKGRVETRVSLVLAAGILLALALPGPESWRHLERPRSALFQIVERNYLSPLLSSARGIHGLNTSAKGEGFFAGYDEFSGSLEHEGRREIVNVTRFAGNLFSLLEVSFVSREASRTSAPAAFISENFWERAFNSDPEVIGKTFRLQGHAVRIAGITRSFSGLLAGTEIWLPVRSREQLGSMSCLRILGTLAAARDPKSARRTVFKAIRAALLSEVGSESSSARLLPVEQPVSFDSEPPAVLAAVVNSAPASRGHQRT